jgi:predicted permease
MLVRAPGFTLIAVLTLALGIGATAAIFSVVENVLLRPLPYRNADRIVLLTETNAVQKIPKTGAPYLDYRDWRDQSSAFEAMGTYWNVTGSEGLVLGGAGSAVRLRGSIVSRGLFTVLGVEPALGRGFRAEEDGTSGGSVFLISDGLWRRRFASNASAIGKAFRIDGQSAILIGVMPPGFQYPDRCEVWLPLSILGNDGRTDRQSHQFWSLGLLRPGVSIERAQAQVSAIQRRLGAAYPTTDANWDVRVTPLIDEYVGRIRKSLLIILGAVLAIFLIACSNVSNLLLMRTVKRRREFSIRAALGAGRWDLFRQAVAENLILASVSMVFALLLAAAGIQVLIRISSGDIPRMSSFHLDVPVLLFTIGLTLLTTVVIALGPAFRGMDANLSDALRDRSAAEHVRSSALQNVLVVSGVALTLLLLCGAGLMLKSFSALNRVNPGFNAEGLITANVDLPDTEYQKIRQRAGFVAQLMADLKTTSGIRSAAAVWPLPLTGETNWENISIAGQPAVDAAHAPSVEMRTITADYFKTMEIPLVEGRTFSGDNLQEAPRTVVINQAMARRFWQGRSPIGQRLTLFEHNAAPREVIGVVGNIKHFGLDTEDDPEMYVDGADQYWGSITVVARGASNASALGPSIRQRVSRIDPEVAVYDVAPMEELRTHSMAGYRLNLFLLGLFAGLALVLAAIGIYGQLAFTVTRRMHDIGVRMALGAAPGTILREIVWQGMKLVVIGLAIGTAASVAAMQLLRTLLYGVGPSDPITFIAVTAVLALVGVLACGIPALRGMSVPPVLALRNE